MLNKFRKIVGIASDTILQSPSDELSKPPLPGANKLRSKLVYSRPNFLDLNTEEDVQASADHTSRPIILPKDVSKLPWNAGYAEVINSGKTDLNEDQARAEVLHIHGMKATQVVNIGEIEHKGVITDNSEHKGANIGEEMKEFVTIESDQLMYFGIFDGHAGAGASLAAANKLHGIIQEQLISVIDLIIARTALESPSLEINGNADQFNSCSQCEQNKKQRTCLTAADFSSCLSQSDKTCKILSEELVIGALETSFRLMDTLIGEERQMCNISGGCAAIVAIFFMGKLYVANAGDCRAVICRNGCGTSASFDFTPESERQRIQMLAYNQPTLLHSEFTRLEFAKRPTRKDLGSKIAYRDGWMTGWSIKTVEEEDLRFPIIYGDGKRARLLATIGVTRGFGDHDLRVYDSNILIKPFLSPVPEVRVFTVDNCCENDVLILGSDGLWDVLTIDAAANIVSDCLSQYRLSNPQRYMLAAQNLISKSRGISQGQWLSGDDISVFVIPLLAPL